MKQVLGNGTNITIVDDDFSADRAVNLWVQNAEANLEDTSIPSGTALL